MVEEVLKDEKRNNTEKFMLEDKIKKQSYVCTEDFEEEVIKEMLTIIKNDEEFKEFKEFSKQTLNKIILGEI